MNGIDIILALLLLYGFYRGFRKGFIVEVGSLLGLGLGAYGAVYFSHFVADLLTRNFDWDEEIVRWASFALTFIGILLLVALLAKALTKFAGFVALGMLNRLLGAVFGTLKTAFILSVVLLVYNGLGWEFDLLSEEKKEASRLYQPIESLAPLTLPKLIEEAEILWDDTVE